MRLEHSCTRTPQLSFKADQHPETEDALWHVFSRQAKEIVVPPLDTRNSPSNPGRAALLGLHQSATPATGIRNEPPLRPGRLPSPSTMLLIPEAWSSLAHNLRFRAGGCQGERVAMLITGTRGKSRFPVASPELLRPRPGKQTQLGWRQRRRPFWSRWPHTPRGVCTADSAKCY